MVQRTQQILPSIGSAFLLSLFDIWYLDELSDLLTATDTRIRIWDSGGYETKPSDDVSAVISAIPSSFQWELEHYVEAAKRIPWNGRDILVSFDNTPLLPVEQQLEIAFAGYNQIEGNYLRDVLLHVPVDYNVANLVSEIAPQILNIDIIGFTEKEIAPTWKRGIQFIHTFNQELKRQNLKSLPIHLFGCLDPKSVIYFTLAGVSVFDGLSWLRYFFHNRTTLYRREFEFWGDFQGLRPTQDIDTAISLHNMHEMQQLHADLNFQLAVGDRIYQQTFIDTYSKVSFAKLYDRKNALVAADLLNDQVLPFFEQQEVQLLRILTDRGTEYCGSLQHHEYQLYMAIENIDHSKTKARHPQTNGICERFHRTIQEEFYAIAFRKKIYTTLEELQTDLDEWMEQYNRERTHTGKYCFGRTPLQTFRETKPLAHAKQLDTLFEQPVGELSNPDVSAEKVVG